MNDLKPGDRLGVEIELPEHPDLTNVRGATERARQALRAAAVRSGVKIHMLPAELYESRVTRVMRIFEATFLRQEAVVKSAKGTRPTRGK